MVDEFVDAEVQSGGKLRRRVAKGAGCAAAVMAVTGAVGVSPASANEHACRQVNLHPLDQDCLNTENEGLHITGARLDLLRAPGPFGIPTLVCNYNAKFYGKLSSGANYYSEGRKQNNCAPSPLVWIDNDNADGHFKSGNWYCGEGMQDNAWSGQPACVIPPG